MTKVVSAPGNLVVATSDGVHVRFAGIELTRKAPLYARAGVEERGIEVNLEGLRDGETVKRDQNYNEALFQWFQRKKTEGADKAGPLPIMPGVLVFDPLELQITDDVGTAYRFAAGQVGGTGIEWTASRMYLPEPPRQAKHLYITFILHGTPTDGNLEILLD